ncbi:MAG: hypothetical protein WBH98_08280 [Bacteroidales bacterium]
MNFKHIDNYAYSVFFLVLFVISLWLGKISVHFDNLTILIALFLLLSAVFTLKVKSGEIVENNYCGIAYTKKTKSIDEPEILTPHETRKGIVGVITPYRQEVFIIRNGIKVKIMPNGEIKETTLIGKFMNTGYKTK